MTTEYKCKFYVSGKVLEVGETQTFSSGFQKRNIIVEASKDAEKFSNPVALTLKKEACSKADSIGVGDFVDAEGYVEGRRWENNGSVRYFTDLNVKSIMVTDKAVRPTTASGWKELVALGAAYGENEDAVKTRCKALGKAFKEMQTADWQKLAADIVAAHAEGEKSAVEDDAGDDDSPF